MKTRSLMLLAIALASCGEYPATRSSSTSTPVTASPRRSLEALRARVAGGSTASVVVDDRDGLSPDEAALLAVDSNPRLRAVRAQRGIAGAEIVSAGLLPNPRVDLGLDVALSRGEEVRAPLGYGAGLAWNVTPLLARSRKLAAANEAAEAVDLEVAWQEWQVAQAARLATARAIYTTRRVTAAAELERLWVDRTAAYRDALSKNAATTLDVANAEHSLADARLARIDFDGERARAIGDLQEALGVSGQRDFQLDMTWHATRPSSDAKRLIDELPERRLDLIALRHAARGYDEALRAALIARFPPVEIGLGAHRDVEEVTTGTATVAFELPFFDRNQANVARSRAEHARTDAEYDARLAEARAQVTRVSRELDIAEERVRAATEAESAATRLASTARQAALSGALTVVAASDLEQRAFAARVRAVLAEQTLAELCIALATVSGADVR